MDVDQRHVSVWRHAIYSLERESIWGPQSVRSQKRQGTHPEDQVSRPTKPRCVFRDCQQRGHWCKPAHINDEPARPRNWKCDSSCPDMPRDTEAGLTGWVTSRSFQPVPLLCQALGSVEESLWPAICIFRRYSNCYLMRQPADAVLIKFRTLRHLAR